MDDLELIARVRDGDAVAERALYEGHAKQVYRLAYRMAGDDHLAREFTQDVFVMVFERLGQFRGEAALSSWVHSVATNVILKGLRRVKRFRERETDLEDAEDVALDRREAEPDVTSRVGAAIDRLPAQRRVVFVMHDVEGHTHEEIAAALGVQVGTSKSQLFRARAQLREDLKDFEPRSVS